MISHYHINVLHTVYKRLIVHETSFATVSSSFEVIFSKMFAKLLTVLFVTFNIVASNDIRLGFTSAHSRKIYYGVTEASPALWKRSEDIVVKAHHNEIISAIYVTDLRDDKDGEAYIESGGVGENSVTIAVKSPSILRGYKFEIEVYAENPNERYHSKGGYIAPMYADTQFARKY